VSAVIPADAVVTMADLARTVHVDPTINDYVARLIEGTRTATEVRLGVSVRGALALIRVAKTFAAASGRHYVVPDDVKTLADPVLAHRILIDAEAEYDGVTASSIIGHVLLTTPPPTERATV
jgi:MoxR-like ATPase